MKLVSIIVPVYNVENFIGECIDSLLNQTYPEIEVLLVNDGSKDRSGEVCKAYEEKDSRVKVFHRENSGVSATRNYGMEQAKGDYIMFVDSDDTIEPDTVKDNVSLIEKKNADMVICGFYYHILDKQLVKVNAFLKQGVFDREAFFQRCFSLILENEIMNPPWNKLIRRSLLEENGIRFHSDFSICEDMAFSMEAINACKRIAVNDKVYYHYMIKESGSLVFKFHHNYYEALSYFFDKAMEYCNSFSKNESQICELYTLFLNLTVMYIKKTVCNKELSYKEKKYKVQRMIRDPRLQDALKRAKLNKKKRLVKYLMKHECYLGLEILYRSSSLIKK